MTATPAAPTPRPRRSLAPGILLGVLAVLLLIVAGVVFGVSQVGARLSSSPAVEIPDVLELDAAGSYDIYLTGDSVRDVSDPVSAIVCDIESGGLQQQVRGADQNLIGSEDGDDELIGGFTASPGGTTVSCDFADRHASSGYFYRVQPSSPSASVAALVLLIAGLVAGGAAALIIVLRVRGRR